MATHTPIRRRAWGVAVLLLVTCEGLAILADRHWSFRARLLSAFDTATRTAGSNDERWTDPRRPFERADGSAAALRWRLPGSSNPIGESMEPSALPAGQRVVVLGESAAFGVGCRAEETFAALLDAQLRPAGIRVLNAGQVGADPWQILEAGAQILARYEPSTLVIFTGNNVWIDWTPPQQPRWSPWGIRVLSTLATSRVIAAAEFLALRWILLHTPRQWRVEQLARAERALDPGDAFHDHHEISGSAYALAHPLIDTPEFGPGDWPAVKRQYLERFARTLAELIEQARARRVRVVLVTMPFNLRLSPAWKHPQFEAVDPAHAATVRRLLHDAGARVNAGDCAMALPLTEQALALDPQPPLLHYLRAQCLERLGRVGEARAAYAHCREQMIGNLGSRLSINDTIRAVGARYDVPVVDAAALFDAYGAAQNSASEPDLILDDCHPGPRGHRLIADALAPLLASGDADSLS